MSTEATSEIAFTITRVFAVSRDRVYEAFTNPDVAKQWWAPAGCSMNELRLDATVGGVFRFDMHVEESGRDFLSEGVYREVVPHERLQWTNCWTDADGARVETLVTLEFADIEGGTEMRLTHAKFPSASMRDDHQHGWGLGLDQLSALMQ